MHSLILLRGVRQLLTFRGPSAPRRGLTMQDLGTVPNAAILIRDGRIAEVGTSRRIENLAAARSATEISAGGRVVMPAFVDPFFAPFSPAGPSPSETSGRLRARAAAMLDIAARHGTACFGLRGALDGPVPGQVPALRAFRALEGHGWDLRTVYCAPPDATVDQIRRVIRRRLAASVQVTPSAADLARQAGSAGIPLRVYAPAGEGAASARLAVELGATTLEAVGEIGPLDIRSLALSQTIAVLMPFCGARPDVTRAMLDHGAMIALATGFGHQIPSTYSQQAVVEAAVDRFGFSLEEALTAVTANAAWAVNAAWYCGSIEPGKTADLIVLNCESYLEFNDTRGVNRVALMLKSGSVVKEPGGDAWKTWS